jgi:autotransporter-associated beta strand protein
VIINGPGTITALAGANELTFINNGSQRMDIFAPITDNAGGAVGVTYASSGNNAINAGGVNTYTGNTVVASGILRMNSATSGNANSAYIVGSNAQLNINGSNGVQIGALSGNGLVTLGNNGGKAIIGAKNTDTTFSGTFTSNAGQTTALEKIGTGTLRLNGFSNSGTTPYTGTTTITAGTLLVNGSMAASAGTIIASGATLGGTGAVSSITANTGANIAPGDGGIGTLTATALSINNGTHFVFDLGTANASDMLALSGALTADSGTSLYTFDFSGGEVNGVYTLATFASTNLSVSQLNASGNYAGTFAIANGNTLTFTASAVPEPATWALIGAGLGVTLLSIRRRRATSIG